MMFNLRIFAMIFGFTVIIAGSTIVQAQNVDLFKDVCKENNDQSSVCKDADLKPNQNPLYGPNGIITTIVNLLSIVVGIAAVIGFIAAGIKFATSSGNSQEVDKARELIIYAVVGLVLALLAQTIVRAVLFKIDVV